MHAAVKLIIGIILVLLGIWLLIPATPTFGLTAVKPATQPWKFFDWWSDFVTVVKGVIPPMIIITLFKIIPEATTIEESERSI